MLIENKEQLWTCFIALGKRYFSLRLFNTFMCDMFLILKTTSFTDYVDVNTSFVVRDNTNNVIKALEEVGENLIKWFSENQMKLNTDKCRVI